MAGLHRTMGCGSSIHDHDIDFFVTMVGRVDVPDTDQGHFRPWRVIDISSLTLESNTWFCVMILGTY